MKRILAASLSLIGFTASTVFEPGYCQGAASGQNANTTLPGSRQGLRSNTSIAPADRISGVKNTPSSGLSNQGGGGKFNPGLGAGGSRAGLQENLNPGRVGDPLGAAQGNLDTGLNALDQVVTDKIGVGKIKAPASTSGTGSGSSGNAGRATDNRSLQDKLVDVAEGQAADALGQDPNGGFSNSATSGTGLPGGSTSSGGAGGAASDNGSSGSGSGDRSEGNHRTPTGTGEGDSGDTGHTTGTGHGSRNGGDSIFEHPTTGQAGAVSVPGANIHIEQDNLGNVNPNLQNGAGSLRNGAADGLGSQLSGVEVRSFKSDGGGSAARPGFGTGSSPFAPGGKFSGVSAPTGGNVLPGGGASGIISPRDFAGGRLPGVVKGGTLGGGTSSVRSLPGVGTAGSGGGLPGGAAVKVPVGNITPIGGIRPNLPNLGAGSIKITPNLNLNTGGSTPSRGNNQPTPTQRPQVNTTRPVIVAPSRR